MRLDLVQHQALEAPLKALFHEQLHTLSVPLSVCTARNVHPECCWISRLLIWFIGFLCCPLLDASWCYLYVETALWHWIHRGESIITDPQTKRLCTCLKEFLTLPAARRADLPFSQHKCVFISLPILASTDGQWTRLLSGCMLDCCGAEDQWGSHAS